MSSTLFQESISSNDSFQCSTTPLSYLSSSPSSSSFVTTLSSSTSTTTSTNGRKRSLVYYGDRFIPLRNNEMFTEFERMQGRTDRPTAKKQKKNILESEEQVKAELESIRMDILEKAMFPCTNNYNIDNLSRSNVGDSASLSLSSSSSLSNLFSFRSKVNNTIGGAAVIDTPFRPAYWTTPFSPQIETILQTSRKPFRIINSSPYQMLAFCDELTLKDDFYLNVVDWSAKNVLALGLEHSVYLWDASSSQMTKLCELEESSTITSIKWSPQAKLFLSCGERIAIGTADGLVQIWDPQKLVQIRDMSGHCARVGCLAWNGNLLTTGSSDRQIFHRDSRSTRNYTQHLSGHYSEICGLKWNHQGDQLASGGNANELFLWDRYSQIPIKRLEGHKAAVRALAWSPHTPNLLVSGGGHLDRQIKFWNTDDGKLLSTHNAKSQVCNIAWSPRSNELVSTHGWWKNYVVVWNYPDMKKIITLKGHSTRVLYFSMSPNGEDIVTGAGGDDNTLRFWKIFNVPAKPKVIRESALNPNSRCATIILEQVRLGISAEEPLAVQQWQGLIAVNYIARKAGIQRHWTIEEARAKCPNLKLVHVATYANGESEPKYHPNPQYATHKVSLHPYRRASARIFEIFQRFCPNTVQRASVDEAFIDVTDHVNTKLTERFFSPTSSSISNEEDGIVYTSSSSTTQDIVASSADDVQNQEGMSLPLLSSSWDDWQLAIAAELSLEIRETVFKELGYTCSSGIAHNKTLAKLCSTILRNSETMNFMETIPFHKIRKLGGKLGTEVENVLKIETAGDLWKLSTEELQSKFGMTTGVWLYNICRGIDTEEVTQRNILKSMMASKSFRPPVTKMSQIEHWANILGVELYTRVKDDYEINQRWPKNLLIHYRCSAHPTSRSKSSFFPHRISLTSPDVISSKILELFKNSNYEFPCSNFSASATGLTKDESLGTMDISKFFLKRSTTHNSVDSESGGGSDVINSCNIEKYDPAEEGPIKSSTTNYLNIAAEVATNESTNQCSNKFLATAENIHSSEMSENNNSTPTTKSNQKKIINNTIVKKAVSAKKSISRNASAGKGILKFFDSATAPSEIKPAT
ncbi:11556_t:CDS:10, partial [Ambispora gerdemannii]